MPDNLAPSAGERLESWAAWLDSRRRIIDAALALVYVLLLLLPLSIFNLWYDELHTFYIAQAPSLAKFVEEVGRLDLNPPLLYALVRASHALFGVTTVATRVPSIIAFFLASLGILAFLSRRIGRMWAAACVALLWNGPLFRYATEARPYALLLAFFSLTLLSWDSAGSGGARSRKSLAGIAIGNSGMMLSHVLAPLSIMPFCIAELVRTIRQRRIDWAMWAALLLPLAWAAAYLPFIHRIDGSIYPPVYQASLKTLLLFYGTALTGMFPGLPIALALAFPLALWRRTDSSVQRAVPVREWPLLIASLSAPVLLNLFMMRTGGPFWDRYAITTSLVIYVSVMIFIAKECKFNSLAGFAAAFVLIAIHLGRDARVVVMLSHRPASLKFTEVKPDLPVAANSALTFLQMDHDEDAAFVRRLYYLTDPPASLKYAKTNIFDQLPTLKEYFPIRANFESYSDFVAQHRHFLVFGLMDQSEYWLLQKLRAEGADLQRLGDFDTPYQDGRLYEVTLAP